LCENFQHKESINLFINARNRDFLIFLNFSFVRSSAFLPSNYCESFEEHRSGMFGIDDTSLIANYLG